MSVRPEGSEYVVDAASAGVRFDKWLADPQRLQSRSRSARALLRGQVFVNDREQTLADGARRLVAGDRVRIWLDRPLSAHRQGPHRTGQLDIVFEDHDVIVLDKPAGLLTVPLPEQPHAESLADRIAIHWRSHGRLPMAVHRLDRDTSGLVVFARTGLARARLKAQFVERRPERRYVAVVNGIPTSASGEWRTWLVWDGRLRRQLACDAATPRAFEAISHYVVREAFDSVGAALLEVRLTTGKRHQIRAQAWLNGHPLIGERMYVAVTATHVPPIFAFERQALHACRLSFHHPRTEELLAFEREPPSDFRQLVDRLRESSRQPARSFRRTGK
ncbi:MAG: RluA family pseudouridine synthase [Vicinamibacterales bacterium]